MRRDFFKSVFHPRPSVAKLNSSMPDKTPIKSLTLDELAEKFRALAQPAYRAKQVLQWLYGKRVKSFAEMTDLPAALRDHLTAEFAFDELTPIRKQGSNDTTQKFLFQ